MKIITSILFAVLVHAGMLAFNSAEARSISIVALGASNTAGKGVSFSSAWPAQLQAMLRAKGYDVRVANEGINGDDTRRMRARLTSAVPGGTQIVILGKPTTNDRKRRVNTNANIAAMRATLHKRGIKTIVITGNHRWANRQLQRDRIHITVAGHRAIASKLLRRVIAIIGRPK